MKRSVVLITALVALAAVVALAGGCASKPAGTIPANAKYDSQQRNGGVADTLASYLSLVRSLEPLKVSDIGTGADIKSVGLNIDTTYKDLAQQAQDANIDISSLQKVQDDLSTAIQGMNDSLSSKGQFGEIQPKMDAVLAAGKALQKTVGQGGGQ